MESTYCVGNPILLLIRLMCPINHRQPEWIVTFDLSVVCLSAPQEMEFEWEYTALLSL